MAKAAAVKYRTLDDVRFEGCDEFGERFRFEAKAGTTVTPKNEQEEAALEQLATLGIAERVAGSGKADEDEEA
ncbi:MAG: hypothetical protein ACRDHM_07435 [Actinomycetota bacterium]